MKYSGNITKNFTLAEVACNDKEQTLLISPEVISHAQRLQKFREWFNRPMRVNSWYRTAAYNKSCGGASKSYHVQGIATDIALPAEFFKYSKERKREFIENMRKKWHELCGGKGGFGMYDNFVHMDSRTSKVDFDYRKNKNY